MNIGLAGRAPHVPLNALGIRQARALAARLPALDRIISSPIQRALETAEALTLRGYPPAEPRTHFTEFDFGEWTGRSFADLERDPRWHEFNESRDTARAPGGESMRDVEQRAVSGVRQVLGGDEGRTIAIVTHAEVIRAILLAVTGTPVRNFWRFQIDAASITELICGPPGDERIVRINDCAHLDEIRT